MEGEEKATQTGDLYDLLSAWDLTQRKAETPPASTARGGFEIKLLDMKSTRDVTSRTYLFPMTHHRCHYYYYYGCCFMLS